ncbi:putative late blight resistance protein homolog R1A-10 [Sesamum indicum]|uniref:Late blight resistance protein homolog R1A-10 n=1 Tax=Sesamum indicum TaxID=4182 RepID=A0A6I9SPM6_SESIN|nr:putative late blight resistance protein homolog R1A-10 [Sesamum indicum]
MAYAAVVSLLQILEQVLISDQLPIRYPKSQIEFLIRKIHFFQDILERNFPAQSSDQSAVNDLEAQIRDAIHKAEDIIESHMSKFLTSESGSSSCEIFSRDLENLLQELDSLVEMAANTTGHLTEISGLTPIASSRSAPSLGRKFVGLKDDFLQLKDQLIGESSRIKVVAVVGMAGIGKTTLVKQVYDDPSIGQIFHYRAWAIMAPNYSKRDILLALLRSVDRDDSKFYGEATDGQLTETIYKNLKGRRYLIVLDDLCVFRAWDDLKTLFPDDGNGSRVMLTTRLRNVALYAAGSTRNIHYIRFLSKDESWELLRDIVFAGKSCSYELEKIGKEIAENCQGLPLTIVFIGDILSRAAKSVEYWRKVADSQTSYATDGDDIGLSSVMQFLNDEHLPQHLKACFLYMGAFPLSYEIPVSKLIKLWVSEGFLKPMRSKTLEKVAEECLEELVDRSLVLVHDSRSTSGIKTCSVHSAVWHLCVSAAEKDKFFLAINRYRNGNPPQSNGRRRLCIRKNILFAIKDVYNSVVSASTARSLLCIGPDHSHPLRVCIGFTFLRVLDVLTIRFYKFPDGILELVLLRYLALTCKAGDLPAKVSKLCNLQFLIVRRHMSIKSSGDPSYLPFEIWNMKQLRHIQFMGGDLPDPCGASLPYLLSLSNVSGHSCSKQVFKATPNLMKLGIRIELAEDTATPLCLLDHLTLLSQLESFKCVIVNPTREFQVVARPDSVSIFPSTLKKITLSGCGFPWEDMKILAQLPNLEALKLGCYAFQGPEWELDEEDFIRLKFLLLEDMDIANWRANGQILHRLERLVVRHCYNLQEIPYGIDYITTLQLVEVVDCSPSVVDSAMRIKEMQEDLSNDDFKFLKVCSWDEKTTKN